MEMGTPVADSEDPLPQEEALCGPAGTRGFLGLPGGRASAPQSRDGRFCVSNVHRVSLTSAVCL